MIADQHIKNFSIELGASTIVEIDEYISFEYKIAQDHYALELDEVRKDYMSAFEITHEDIAQIMKENDIQFASEKE